MDCPVCKAPLDGSPKFCARCGSATDGAGSSATAMAPPTEAEPRFDPFIGTTVSGRYKITKLLGEGGMGAVYVGEQNIGGTVRKVAIKTLHAHLSKDPKILQRFERECATVAELQHPNTIQLYDFGKTDDGILYMVMEFVQGESLAAVLEKRGALEPARSLHILQQICDALGEAHSLGIVHRDLKPDNIVLTERAKDWVKVLDFGIAKRSEAQEKDEQKLTQQGTVLGTPPYMSPEQFTGRPIDARSDIYSIAVMAYEMLAGRLPFTAATPWEWATQHMTVAPQPLAVAPNGTPIPEPMIRAIMQSLAKDPNERPGTTKELYEALSVAMPSHEALSMSGGFGVAPPSMVANSGYAPPSLVASGGFTPAPMSAGAAPGGPGAPEGRGKTQLGDSSGRPDFGGPAAFAPPSGVPPYGPPGGPGGAGGAPYGTPAAGNFAVPPGPPARSNGRSGGGTVFAVLGLFGLLAAGAVIFAFTRGPKASATTTPTSTATATVTDATDAGDGASPDPATTSDHPRRNHQPPLIDTSLPPLPTPPDSPSVSHHDAGTTPPPPPPANDPHVCKSARALQQKLAQTPSPSPKMLKNFNAERAKCISEGGHL
jgi:serine/threonine protein kinase